MLGTVTALIDAGADLSKQGRPRVTALAVASSQGTVWS
jgi:hypothetical protein